MPFGSELQIRLKDCCRLEIANDHEPPELDGLVRLAYELMKKEGIAKFATIHDNDCQTVIVAEKKPVGRPRKAREAARHNCKKRHPVGQQ
jgi:hypothetical protein